MIERPFVASSIASTCDPSCAEDRPLLLSEGATGDAYTGVSNNPNVSVNVNTANANINDIIEIIKPLGLASTKAKNIQSIANDVLIKFNGKVPETFEELVELSGVGEKTAQVVLIEGLNKKAFPVDTHILRVSKRLNLIDEKLNATQASKELKTIFEDNLWNKLHQQMVLFGRYHCLAKKPKCNNCKLVSICKGV